MCPPSAITGPLSQFRAYSLHMEDKLSAAEFSSLLELTYGGNQKQPMPKVHRNKLLALQYIVAREDAATAKGKRLLDLGE
jgi:hypothetical protein